MSLSIRAAYERQQELIREADAVWSKMAEELVELIPVSMMIYARQKGWLKIEGDSWWTFPMFLKDLATRTSADGCSSQKIRDTDLRMYGFASFQELEAGINDLSRTWEGLVRISISTGEVTQWEIYFYADELNKAPCARRERDGRCIRHWRHLLHRWGVGRNSRRNAKFTQLGGIMSRINFRTVGYKVGRVVRTSLMTVFLLIFVSVSLFMGVTAVYLVVAAFHSIVAMKLVMALYAAVGFFMTATTSYLYGLLVPVFWQDLRRPNIAPSVPTFPSRSD